MKFFDYLEEIYIENHADDYAFLEDALESLNKINVKEDNAAIKAIRKDKNLEIKSGTGGSSSKPGGTVMVLVLSDNREEYAEKFAEKHYAKGAYVIDSKKTTPMVMFDDYIILFKNKTGSTGNGGHEYEKSSYHALKAISKENKNQKPDEAEEKARKHFETEVEAVIKALGIKKENIVFVDHTGTENAARPMNWSAAPSKLVTQETDVTEIGKKLADIVLTVKKGKKEEKIYISNKTSSQMTWINTSLGRSPEERIENIKKICKIFGISYAKYLAGMNNYVPKEEMSDEHETPKAKEHKGIPDNTPTIVKNFLKCAIGANYFYMHTDKKFMMTEEVLNKLINKPRNFKIHYPGPGRKRLDIYFETDGMHIKMNLRTKEGGGTWPKMLMCDYKFK